MYITNNYLSTFIVKKNNFSTDCYILVHFLDPVTGAHTQNIENTWWQIKRNLPSTYTRQQYIGHHLCEFMYWRIRRNSADIFKQFLRDVGALYQGAH